MRESDLVKVILEYLNYSGHFCWRNNTGFAKHNYTLKSGEARTSVFRAGIKGSSDILGVSKTGKMIAIECKMPGKVLTPEQTRFLSEVKARKGIALVAYQLEDVQEEL